jgi:hypothetical protein
MRLTKLPLTIVIHKRVETADTIFMERAATLVHNRLEKSRGLFNFGKYVTADPTKEYAFVKIREMWDEPVEDSREEEEEGESEDETTPNNNDTEDDAIRIAPTDKRTTKRKRKQQDTQTEQRPITRTKTQHQEINTRELSDELGKH